MNNPPIRLSNDQFHALNRLLAIAEVSVQINQWHHHDPAIHNAKRVMAMCEVDPVSFRLSEVLNPGWDGTEGQDRESYSDNQDRNNYTTR